MLIYNMSEQILIDSDVSRAWLGGRTSAGKPDCR
jgi:hypothetical protein